MAEMKKYAAVDIGAESGRVILGTVSAQKLELEEVHSFKNVPVYEYDSLRWDFKRIFDEIKIGISKAFKRAGAQIWSMGIDTWGVDFGLLDSNGCLIENPYHFRDCRTDVIMEKAFEILSKKKIYENTGLQSFQYNTLYQILSMKMSRSVALARAKHLLFMPDLLSYFLCGKIYSEYTIASTSQLLDIQTQNWSREIFDKFSLPLSIMPKIVRPGTIIGQIIAKVGTEIGCGPIPVVAVGAHNTALAIAAIPAMKDNWAFILCGKCNIVGVEMAEPLINKKTFELGFANEAGVEGTIRLIKSVMGLQLIQECKKQWDSQADELSYDDIAELAEKAKPFTGFVDVDDKIFLEPENMPEKINKYMEKTGQKRKDKKGDLARIILEGLAFKIRMALEELQEITLKKIDAVHIVGDGVRSKLLCQFIADAAGREVIAGPFEATVSGNILMQAKATGQINSMRQFWEIVSNSFELIHYQPKEASKWEKQYKKMKKLIKNKVR